MSVGIAYLDSSSIVKRYVEEKGSEIIDEKYRKAEAGKVKIAFSIWNVGEVLGAIDKYRLRRVLSDREVKNALASFIGETVKMMRLGSLIIQPITARILVDSWLITLKHHVYQADAIQISTSKHLNPLLLMTADRKLVEVAEKEGLKAVNVEE